MIRFFTETSFHLKNKRKTAQWIKSVILNEEKKLGEINFIFCDDEYLRSINKEYLGHDYYTDVISFDNSTKTTLSGEIYISIDRVRQNALTHNTPITNELHRVMIHGILHFLGFSDKNDSDKTQMTAQEDYCLSLLDK